MSRHKLGKRYNNKTQHNLIHPGKSFKFELPLLEPLELVQRPGRERRLPPGTAADRRWALRTPGR